MEIDIKKIAKLAKLKIEEKDLPRITQEMLEVIESVEHLPMLADEGALLNPENTMELREDEAKQFCTRNELLKNAPQIQAGCIVVPKTVE